MQSSASATHSRKNRKLSKGSSLPSLKVIAAESLNELRATRQTRTIQKVVKPYIPHPPSPKQEIFLRLDVEEAFFGGAAGGGKSDALLMAALQYVDVPGYAAIIFRRTKSDLTLPGAILDRAVKWWTGTNARWDEEISGFRFPTRRGEPDATISFSYLQHEDDKYRYQGSEFQFIGFDELTHFTESQYRYLFSRIRRLKGFPVPLRMRSAGNPGGRGHEWVKARFVQFAKLPTLGAQVIDHKEFLRRRRAREELPSPAVFQSPPSADVIELSKVLKRQPQGAYFVPSFAEDNTGLDLDAYKLSLVNLDPTERQQLEDGDWDAVPSGKFFNESMFKYLDEDAASVEKRIRTIRYWDLAGTEPKKGKDPDWSASVRMGIERDETGAEKIIITHATRFRENPGGVETRVRGVAQADGYKVTVYIEEEPGSAGKNNTHNYASRVLKPPFIVNGHKKTGPKPEFWKPLANAARNGLVYLVRGDWNADFVRELCALPNGSHDDQADAAGGALAMLTSDRSVERARMLARAR